MKPEDVKYIVVHCSATPPDRYIDARAIDRMHRLEGWTRIGYHWVITNLGEVQPGRKLNEQGAHVRGHNHESIGICLAGGINAKGKAVNNFSAAQFEALKTLLVDMQALFPEAEILGHRDLSPDLNHDGEITPDEWLKECPCFDVRKWCKENL